MLQKISIKKNAVLSIHQRILKQNVSPFPQKYCELFSTT